MNEAEEAAQEAQEETHEEATTEQEAASSAVETEAFDVDAERARIAEQVEAKYAGWTPPAQAKQEETPEPDLEELMFSDPKAYRAALIAQAKAEMRAEFAPAIKAVESDRLVNELGGGLGEAGRRYLRESLGGVSIEMLPEGLKDMARRAARDRDREANPQRVTPERSTATGSGEPVIDAETMRIFGKHMAPEEIAKYLKENQ